MFKDKTFLQHIMTEELKTFFETAQITYQNTLKPLDFTDGSFLFSVNSASNAFQKSITKKHLSKIANYTSANTSMYRQQLGTSIIKIDFKDTIAKALQVIYDTKTKINDSFAGALLIVRDKGIINPLHPLVALELTKYQNYIVDKLIVFTYKDLKTIEQEYSESSPDFAEDINLLIQMYQSQVKERAIKITDNKFDEERKRVTQNYQIAKYENEDEDKEYYLVVHQLLTNGTFVPYYGTSLIAMSNAGTSGFHLSPFKSCNISSHNSIFNASVCTGSTSNRTIKGLRTLHHANLGSPYERSCMTTVSKPYADACINYSFNIFKHGNIIKD